jgi:hypothetical protein
MNYENELIELIPMLKSYLKKINVKYHNSQIDVDDILGECVCNIVKASNKSLDKPRNYFIGICDKTIKSIYKRNYKEAEKIEVFVNDLILKADEIKGRGILSQLNQCVKNEKKTVQRIWEAMLTFNGNTEKISEYLQCHPQTVFYHKRKLKKLYQQVCC